MHAKRNIKAKDNHLVCSRKQTKNVQRQPYCTIAFALIALSVALFGYTNPGVAACAMADNKQKYPVIFAKLLTETRNRIQNAFGTPQAKPILIFFYESNAFGPLKLNEYGSTHFLGTKVCVMIGPKGQNPDVVAHELMHAEIAERVGYWHRFTQLPIWFDEGLAMQVDFRPQYKSNRGDGVESVKVKKLWSAKEFFVQDDGLLTQNYASAKTEVARWVAGVVNKSVYRQLERIRNGESFDAVINGE